jgi:Uma2 family endonuclease
MNAQVEIKRFKLDIDRYHQMIAAGLFRPDDKVELIDGDLIEMAPEGPLHADYITYMAEAFAKQSTPMVRVSHPITLPAHSEPEPDIALVARRRYLSAHPLPGDIYLLVEIAKSSLDKDKELKLPLYARYHIPEVWIVDVADRAVECHWSPQDGLYSETRRVSTGVLAAATQPDVKVDLDALWDQN